jgi:integrase
MPTLRTAPATATAGYIKRVIRPVLGHVPIKRLGARELEALYAELRRCRQRCAGKPFIEHKKTAAHDCTEAECTRHKCDPMASSTVRQIHSIISSALSAAVRWHWIDTNPAKVAKRPEQTRAEPDPPSPADLARLVDKAFELGDDWGALVWLVMTTGMRRAEVAGLRWSNVDLDAEAVEIRRSYVESYGKGKEKDTKTHQMRRLALDSETVALLRTHQEWCRAELEKIDVKTDRGHVRLHERPCRRPNHWKAHKPRRHRPLLARRDLTPLQAHGDEPRHQHPPSRPTPLLSHRTPHGRHRPRHRRRPPRPNATHFE